MRKAIWTAILLLVLVPVLVRAQLLMTGVGGPTTGPGGGSAIGWDNVNSAAGMTISGANQTIATTSGSNGTWRSAISSTTVCSGNYYAEVTANTVSANGTIIGLVGGAFNTALQWQLTGLVGQSLGWQGSATGSAINMSSSTTLPYTSADVLSVAFKTSNKHVWVRKNGGAWAGGGDPAADTTPSGIATLGMNAGVQVVFAGENNSGTSDVATINATSSPAFSIPSGFTALNVGTTCSFANSTNGFNPAGSSANFTFSNTNNDTAATTGSAGSWRSAKTVSSHSSGKFFVEHFIKALDGGHGIILGFGNSSTNTASFAGADGNSLGCQQQGSGQGGSWTSCATWSNGDTVDFEIDTTAKKLWMRINGAGWSGGGDPEAGTTPSATYTTSGAMFAVFSGQFNSSQADTDRIYTGTTPVYAPTASYSVWN